ncbi:hypothetical protein QJS64_00515 [Paraclostridium bifermentans]|uniref:Uncharacterized protein n=1 Tax=Paraclostridium bifermentans TaxID=1490 RepID=A0ABY8R3H7_PARBF|nr:hypothetical protein QJS64_00515 [Paraclostridium bifermentans]
MKMLNNFFKKINNPAPAFNQTKMEKETSNDNSDSTKPKTTFNDVAGLEEVKEELFEIVDFMKNPTKYQKWVLKFLKVFYSMDLLVQVKHCLHQLWLVKRTHHFSM